MLLAPLLCFFLVQPYTSLQITQVLQCSVHDGLHKSQAVRYIAFSAIMIGNREMFRVSSSLTYATNTCMSSVLFPSLLRRYVQLLPCGIRWSSPREDMLFRFSPRVFMCISIIISTTTCFWVR